MGTGTVYAASSENKGPTDNIIEDSRIADPDTTDTYQGKLLNDTSGTRYAGRVWTDKSVFAYSDGGMTAGGVMNNEITLDNDTDGYDGKVKFNSDFAHVFSALASTQLVNEYPPTPVDLVIVFDMSGSMGQDTRYGIDSGSNSMKPHDDKDDSPGEKWPAEGVSMEDRIENSRIQTTLTAINETIDKLMEQNPQNRVAVCGYGANAAVLMPLAHYRHKDGDKDQPYLSVGGMETLYHPSDLQVVGGEWRWQNNRDTCYTVEVNAEGNNYTGVLDPDGDKDSAGQEWKTITRTVSNNVIAGDSTKNVKAFPGVAEQTKETLRSSAAAQGANADKTKTLAHRSSQLTEAMAGTEQLDADDYVGYFTNTQGGIYLAYKQLADSEATTYTEKLSNGVDSTVARIPAAIVMSDGGANFAFNQMGNNEETKQTVNEWNARYGQPADSEKSPGTGDDVGQWYINDDSYDGGGHDVDYSHRLNANKGNEWYKVYLPGNDTLAFTSEDDDWDGLHGLCNIGADYYEDGTLSSDPKWPYAGVLYSSDNNPLGTSGTVLQVLLTASYMKTVVNAHYTKGWEEDSATTESRVGLSTYTMNVDTEHVPQWGRLRLYPTLDPKDYSLDKLIDNSVTAKWYNDDEQDKTRFGVEVDGYGSALSVQQVYDGLGASWKEWKESGATEANMDGNKAVRIITKSIAQTGGSAEYIAGGKDPDYQHKITVTDKDIKENINYNDNFFDVTSQQLSGTFGQILTEILGKVFVPVSGDNDAGVSDSITYQDPIGDYMEIKSQSITTKTHSSSVNQDYDMALLSFGKMHGLVRTGVYDFRWNDQYMKAHSGQPLPGGGGTIKPGETPLPIGWYKGSPSDADYGYNDKGLPNDDITSAEQAWVEGWVLRINNQTVIQYVPIAGVTASTKPGEMPDYLKNTTYTVYRFAGSQEERNKLLRNPIYDPDDSSEAPIPKDTLEKYKRACTYKNPEEYNAEDAVADTTDAWQKHVKTYPDNNDTYKDAAGVYRLSDIRVWVEEYGDYKDDAGNITPNSNAYDASLYMNIPVAAVPTQLAEIDLGKNGVRSYKSNIDDPKKKDECTPIRLFYAVGVDEDVLNRDEDGRSSIDISKLSREYVQAHTDEDNNIWFISNYYSNTPYDGYITDEGATSRTRGDPAVSFSPGEDNRYYVFQKPLPLFAHAYRVTTKDGKLQAFNAVDNAAKADKETWTVAENKTGGNGSTKWETYNGKDQAADTWIGGQCMGTYTSYGDKDAEGNYKAGSFMYALENAVTYNDKGEKDDNGTTRVITDSEGERFEVIEDGIIFLSGDAMSHVTTDKNGKEYADGSVAFNSDDYFFLTVEHFLPDRSKKGIDDKGETINDDKVYGGKTVKRVIARKGSEFGSGYKSEKITNGSMLCWTDRTGTIGLELEYRSKTDTGDITRGEPTWEKLTLGDSELKDYLKTTCGMTDDDAINEQVDYWKEIRDQDQVKKIIEDIKKRADDESAKPEELFAKEFEWTVAARKGGIRTGDMAQNRSSKSTNTTTTAYNYYIPTVSDTSGTGSETVINNYLGNNGRLMVANDSIMATKLLEAPDASGYDASALNEYQKAREFNYQIYAQDVTGTRDAVILDYNAPSGTWQRRIAYIDMLTDNSNLLLDNSSNRALFDKDGKQVIAVGADEAAQYYYDANEDGTLSNEEQVSTNEYKGELYYMYLPSNGGGTVGSSGLTRRIYQDANYTGDDKVTVLNNNTDKFYSEDEGDHPAGSHTYGVTDAKLIKVSDVTSAESDPGAKWSYTSGGEDPGEITLFTRKPDSDTSQSNVISPFSTHTTYMTKTLKFGENANTGDGGAESGALNADTDLYDTIVPKGDRPDLFGSLNNDEIAKHTAEFTLKNGEGLLLTGMNNRIVYRFTEKLTQDDLKQGYELKEVDHTQQRGSKNIYHTGMQQIPVYTKSGATYGDLYPKSNAKTPNGLTWALNSDGSKNTAATVTYEPFNHSNAVIWDYYATLGADEVGNHHQRDNSVQEETTFYEGETNTGIKDLVERNPSCATCDEPVYEDGKLVSYLHYMYKEGKPVDFHYEGESSAFFRNMARFLVSTTAHFGVKGETQNDAESAPPVKGSTNYSGVYSTFGNTGYFEEQSHFINTFEPNSISITKELGAQEGAELNKYDKNTEFDFTLTLAEGTGETSLVLPETLDYSVIEDVKNTDGTIKEEKVVKEGKLISMDSSETVGTNDIKAEEEGVWKFRIKAGQTMRVKNLPVGTSYTYKVAEDSKYSGDDGGYITEGSLAGTPSGADKHVVSGEVTSKDSGPVRIVFTNIKKAPESTTAGFDLTKKVTDETEPDKGNYELAAEDFSFVVTPSSDNPEDDPIKGIKWDETKKTGWNEKTGTLTVKNGEAEKLDPPDPTGRTEKAKAQVLPDSTVFDKAGTYVYTVREEIPNEGKPGISYTAKRYKVTIEVEEDYGDDPDKNPVYTGKLKATVTITELSKDTPETAAEFENTFDKNKVSVILQAKKLLKAKDESDVPFNPDDYEFRLTRVETEDEDGGSPAAISRNADDPDVKASSEATEPSGTAEKKAKTEAESKEPTGETLDSGTGGGSNGSVDPGENGGKNSASDGDNSGSNGGMNTTSSGDNSGGTTEPSSISNESSDGLTRIAGDSYMPEGDGDKAKNDIDGWAYFGPITYKDVGTYEYEIVERKGLKTGVEYDEAVYHVTVEVTRDKATEALQAKVTYTRHEKDDPDGTGTAASTAEFTNHVITGNLEIDKTVTGKAGDKKKDFDFRITLTDAVGNVLTDVNGRYGDMNFTKGVAEFTLRHGEVKTAKDLPVDAHYKVEEENYESEGYETASENESGTITKDVTAEAEFTNDHTDDEDTPGEEPKEPGTPDKPENPDNPDKSNPPNDRTGSYAEDGHWTETGDDTDLIIWMIAAAVSGIALLAIAAVTVIRRRRS